MKFLSWICAAIYAANPFDARRCMTVSRQSRAAIFLYIVIRIIGIDATQCAAQGAWVWRPH